MRWIGQQRWSRCSAATLPNATAPTSSPASAGRVPTRTWRRSRSAPPSPPERPWIGASTTPRRSARPGRSPRAPSSSAAARRPLAPAAPPSSRPASPVALRPERSGRGIDQSAARRGLRRRSRGRAAAQRRGAGLADRARRRGRDLLRGVAPRPDITAARSRRRLGPAPASLAASAGRPRPGRTAVGRCRLGQVAPRARLRGVVASRRPSPASLPVPAAPRDEHAASGRPRGRAGRWARRPQ